MGRKKDREKGRVIDNLMLYEASVQNVEESVPFVERLFNENRGRRPHSLREDFCGSAAFACEWVRNSKKNSVIGLDLDEPTLTWAHRNNISQLTKKQQQRLQLMCCDVRSRTVPVDVVTAFNFSYCIFKDRPELRNYLQCAFDSLVEDGVFICDLFGGTEGMNTTCEERIIPKKVRRDGTKIPSFKYTWEHEHFNVVNHDILCHIHFKIRGHERIERAFTYDWRLWTIPEMRDVMLEVGFSAIEVYLHGWTHGGESDEEYKRTRIFENAEGWLAYLVALK